MSSAMNKPPAVNVGASLQTLAAKMHERKPDDVVVSLSATAIEPDPNNPRKTFNKETIEELAESMAAHGQVQPIIVRRNPVGAEKPYQIIAGERRWRAATLKSLPLKAIVRDAYGPDQVALVQFAENHHRENLSPEDAVRAVVIAVRAVGVDKAMEGFKVKKSWISKVVGIHQSSGPTKVALTEGLTGDIDALYRLSLLEQEDEGAANALVEHWRDPSNRKLLRRQVDSATEEVKAKKKKPGGKSKKRKAIVHTVSSASKSGDQVVIVTQRGPLVFDKSLLTAIRKL